MPLNCILKMVKWQNLCSVYLSTIKERMGRELKKKKKNIEYLRGASCLKCLGQVCGGQVSGKDPQKGSLGPNCSMILQENMGNSLSSQE